MLYGRKFFRFVGFICALIGVFFAIVESKAAQALDVEKPAIMQGDGSAAQADGAVTKIVEFVLYFGYAAASVALVIGLVLCLEVVGQPRIGKQTVKSAIVVMIVIGLIHILFGFLGGLFG